MNLEEYLKKGFVLTWHLKVSLFWIGNNWVVFKGNDIFNPLYEGDDLEEALKEVIKAVPGQA